MYTYVWIARFLFVSSFVSSFSTTFDSIIDFYCGHHFLIESHRAATNELWGQRALNQWPMNSTCTNKRSPFSITPKTNYSLLIMRIFIECLRQKPSHTQKKTKTNNNRNQFDGLWFAKACVTKCWINGFRKFIVTNRGYLLRSLLIWSFGIMESNIFCWINVNYHIKYVHVPISRRNFNWLTWIEYI